MIILKEVTKRHGGEVTKRQEEITLEQYKNYTDKETLKMFRRLGGTETAQKTYTSAGYVVTRLISTSPDKQIKVVRTFEFK